MINLDKVILEKAQAIVIFIINIEYRQDTNKTLLHLEDQHRAVEQRVLEFNVAVHFRQHYPLEGR